MAYAFHRNLARAVCGVALAVAIGVASAAAAPSSTAAQAGGLKDSSPHDRPLLLSFFTGIPYGYYAGYGFPFSLGGRFGLPIVENGFIPSLNDEFGLEFGLDFNFIFLDDVYRDSLAFSFGLPAEAYYDFHFSSTFDAYVKAGFQIGGDFSRYTHDGFWAGPISVVGMRLWFAGGAMCFRAEVGYPWIKAGIGFAF